MKTLEVGKKPDYTRGISVDSVYFREYDGIETYHHTLCHVADPDVAKKAISLISVDHYYIQGKVCILKYIAKHEKLVWGTIINHVNEPIQIIFGDSEDFDNGYYKVLIMSYNDDVIMALKLSVPQPNFFINEIWE